MLTWSGCMRDHQAISGIKYFASVFWSSFIPSPSMSQYYIVCTYDSSLDAICTSWWYLSAFCWGEMLWNMTDLLDLWMRSYDVSLKVYLFASYLLSPLFQNNPNTIIEHKLQCMLSLTWLSGMYGIIYLIRTCVQLKNIDMFILFLI